MESADTAANRDYSDILEDIDSPQHKKKMGLSAKSKTFTIENLLKSDAIDEIDLKSASAIKVNRPSAGDTLIEDATSSCDLLLNRLDLAARQQQDPNFIAWLRSQHNPAPPPTHYLFSGLSGN